MDSPKDISIKDYVYDLPEDRIARFPLAQRDDSSLLAYKKGGISYHVFKDIPEHLPKNALLVFNDTKVIHARLYFYLENGTRIEILCLEPLQPIEYQQNLSSVNTVRWKCLVGGNRKWKQGVISRTFQIEGKSVVLTARRNERLSDSFDIQFEWDNDGLAFGELLAQAGNIPLPPYLNREAEPSDKDRYQTIYANEKGSVAAPTAGLHFTDRVFQQLATFGIQPLYLTLHVGAGTFKPVKADRLEGHHMHEESIYIKREKLISIHDALKQERPVVAVGTTSMRTLESLYWYGVQLFQEGAYSPFEVEQWIPYEGHTAITAAEAVEQIIIWLDKKGMDTLIGQTQLIIAPGYQFRVANGLVTNFHQPGSTLLLLIAALIGEDWRKVYTYAMDNDFRFLSYGDSSLLLP